MKEKDREVELLWESLEDMPFDFDKNMDGTLDVNWYIFFNKPKYYINLNTRLIIF
jgi:hypothetical protein